MDGWIRQKKLGRNTYKPILVYRCGLEIISGHTIDNLDSVFNLRSTKHH